MQIKQFIGIDVSKKTLDITILDSQGKQIYYERITNESKSIKSCFSSFMKQYKAIYEESVFCMEYTGIYNLPLVKWLKNQSANIWMESGSQINKSQGLVRGKNDKVDSLRIANYAFTNRHSVKLWQAPREIINRLSDLLALRSRFVKAKKQLVVPVNEQNIYLDKESIKTIKKHNQAPVNAITKEIEKIEKEIVALIKSDERLYKLYKIVTSVDGVGPVTATSIIITTNEFLSITEAKKYACYSGVAPFDHSSGSSIRGRNRVSHMANKKIKTLLHLAALSAIRVKGDISEYYNRKVAEGKNKMSVLNAIRNKLVQRIFACVKQDRLFEKKYQYLFG